MGHSQTISQPYIEAYMTEVLDLASTDRVLEIGTGSGCRAAVLAERCRHVYTIEIVPELGERARGLHRKLGYGNISVRIGAGYRGAGAQHTPFDAVIVTCAPGDLPRPLQRQLREGGRMVIPVGSGFFQKLLLRRKDGRLEIESSLPVRFAPWSTRPAKSTDTPRYSGPRM